MFENFKIKRLQREILKRGKFEEQIKKSGEELSELFAELSNYNICRPFKITNNDLKRNVGNMQKEIADVENIICKLKMMFVQTPQQRLEYRASKQRIIEALKIYLKGR